MRVFIDTHTFLWFVSSPTRMTDSSRAMIERPDATVLISIASIWEISIKTSLGKLIVDGGFPKVEFYLSANTIDVLPITFEHTLRNNQLPFHHKDPFDRMIAAQALVERLDLISNDDTFDPYFAATEVKRVW